MAALDIGISGFSLYTPPFKVSLERWCEWTGNQWDKVSSVVGRSFRQPGEHESIYTMAANAVLRLIEQYDIDPRQVGLLAFGTESATDNAAGAVIVRGMVDRALEHQGKPRLARSCEVPEFKHACLGGVYALKAAVRYIAADGRGKKAIVVCGDIAEYERGSSGEQTQGAGTVAMLVEEDPRLCRIDLSATGSSSDYRALDFRKPFSRHFVKGYAPNTKRLHDFPVFNGKYSTVCYQDAVAHAMRDLFERTGAEPTALFRDVAAIFMHRPYHWMPISGMATIYTFALAESDVGRKELAVLCERSGVSFDSVLAEIRSSRDLMAIALDKGIDEDPYPHASSVVKQARASAGFKAIQNEKMRLGSELMKDLGNLYTAALPAWLAGGFEQALEEGVELSGKQVLAIGYGSGDAAEAMMFEIVPGWRSAAARIGVARALEGAVELTREQYEARHDGKQIDVAYTPHGEFVIERVGASIARSFEDVGIEYYRYVPHLEPLSAAAE